MRDLERNIVVFLTGASATVVIGHINFDPASIGMGHPNPSLGVVLAFLFCMPSLGIGYFATRAPLMQSALAYVVGSLAVTMMDYVPAAYPGSFFFPRAEIPAFLCGRLIFVAGACVLAYVGTWLRGRVRRRLDQNRDTRL
jgi:hypothetical protein